MIKSKSHALCVGLWLRGRALTGTTTAITAATPTQILIPTVWHRLMVTAREGGWSRPLPGPTVMNGSPSSSTYQSGDQ